MGPMNRERGPRLKAAVAASVELQERDALKGVGLAATAAPRTNPQPVELIAGNARS
jgi:hypothetical protein